MPPKQKPVSQLGEGSATIEQMLGTDLPKLMGMSDEAITAYIQPALKAVAPITERSLILKPSTLVKTINAELKGKRNAAKAARKAKEGTVMDLLRKTSAVKSSYQEKMQNLQKLKDMLGEEEGLAAAEEKSVGDATVLMVKHGNAGEERKKRLQSGGKTESDGNVTIDL